MLRPAERFDRYVIEELLGEGGMGRVYRALDEKLRRSVALKVLRVESAAEDAASARLVHEARAAAALDHTNTIAIYDVGEVNRVPFIAMELVVGRSLRESIGDAAVPLSTRMRYLVDVARALAAAHDRGILHRDIKPENVIVRHDGVVKVLDFGLADFMELQPRSGCAEDLPSGVHVDLDVLASSVLRTRTGSARFVGTPRYMAPEQLRGDALDPRTDQFAWGVVAYELLTGAPPWKGAGQISMELLASILADEPVPAEPLAQLVPPGVAYVVRRALAKGPDERFPSMAQIIELLEQELANANEPGVPAKVHPRRPAPVAADIEVPAEFSHVIVDAFGPFRAVALRYMERYGLVAVAQGTSGARVPLSGWLDALYAMIEEVGGGVLYNIGQRVPALISQWPVDRGIEAAVSFIDVAYHGAHTRGGKPMFDPATGEFIEGIGHYRVVAHDPVARRMTVTCDNPYPCEMVHGIVTAAARGAEPLARVDHEPVGCRTVGAASCSYSVSWG